MAFGGHLQGEKPIVDNAGNVLVDSVYLSKAPSDQIISIAHQGDPAPGGGFFRRALGPILDQSGQVLFVGDLTAPPDALKTTLAPSSTNV